MSSRLRSENDFAMQIAMTASSNKNRDERLAEALRANLRRRKAANPPQKASQDVPEKSKEPL